MASWDVDFFLTQDPNDENLWYYNSIDLNGDVKFRADSNWTVNWGATDFPVGIGTQDGPNIPAAPGTYGIIFNSATGEYQFVDPLSTLDILDPSIVTVYPNPVSDQLQIDLTATDITGDIKISVFDVNGKLVMSEAHNTNGYVTMGVSSLQTGYYLMHISNDKYIIGKKFAVVK